MASNDELFLLIQSMTKSEKRYFKVQASRHIKGDGNNYVLLFDLLAKMEVYDKNKVIERFKGERFLNNFSTAKRYLFDAITDSLLQFHAQDLIEAQLQKQVNKAKLLIGRGLYKEVNKIVRKVKQQATKYQLYTLLEEVLNIEKTLISASKSPNKSYEDIFECYDNIIQALSTKQTIYELGKYHQQLHVLMKKRGRQTTEQQRRDIKTIAELPLIQENRQADCFRAQMLTLEILNKLAIYNNDWESSYQHYRQLYQLYKKKPWLAPSPSNRMMMMHNYLYRCAFTERYREMKQVLAEAKNFATDAMDNSSSTFFECYYSPLLIYCRKTADFEATKNLPRTIEAGMEEFQQYLKLPFKLNMICQVSVLLFMKMEYADALGWINRFIDHSQKNVFVKVLPSALVFRLLVYAELEAFRLLEYQIRNTQRALQNIGLYPSFSNTFIAFFKEWLNAPDLQTQIEVYKALEVTLKDIYTSETAAFGMFDFMDWVESKIQRRQMYEVIRDKEEARNKLK